MGMKEGKKMLKLERQNIIEKELHEKGSVLVSELSKLLECSEETIRRDIKEMEVAGKLNKIHGGAYLPDKYDKGVPIELRETFFENEKELMAMKAIEIIKEHSVIMLDSSTTCLKLAEAIVLSGKCVTLITNSLRISSLFNAKSSNVNLICLGGQLHKPTASFTGYRTTDNLKQNFADISFISCPSAHLVHGLSDNNLNQGEVRKHMLENSHYKVLIVDHTKIDSISDVLFYDISTIDLIITDIKLPITWEEYCKEASIEIIYS